MSALPKKESIDYRDKPLRNLPDLPSLTSLSEDERNLMEKWWSDVREVFDRNERVRSDETEDTKPTPSQTPPVVVRF
jgi:hypothetical protein